MFSNQQLLIKATSGQIKGSPLLNTEAMIPDITHGTLTLTGQLNTNLATGVNFIETTPLKERFGGDFKNMQLSGPAHLELKIIKPLYHSYQDVTKVFGAITIQNSQIFFPSLDLQIEDVGGKLKFTNNGISSNGLQGTLLQQPINASISTLYVSKKSSIMQVNVSGHLTIDALRQRYHWLILNYIKGESDYRALFQFSNDPKKHRWWSLLSGLRGISIDLPKPFAKSASQFVPLKLTADYFENSPMDLKLYYGDLLNAIFKFDSRDNSWTLNSSDINLGKASFSFNAHTGLIIGGEMKQLDWKIWYPFIQSYLQLNKVKKPSSMDHFLLNKVQVKLGELNIHGISLKNIELTAIPKKDSWEFGLNNDAINGTITLPNDYMREGITAYFKRLYLSDGEYSVGKHPLKSNEIPSLNIFADDFRFGERNFGKTQLITERTRDKMLIKQFRVDSSIVHLLVNGEWRSTLHHQFTSISGTLNSQNLGQVLKDWDVNSNLYDGKGTMKFNFHWLGLPFKFGPETLGGQMKFDFYNGRITGLSSKANKDLGFGSFLTLLSLQSLSQRVETGFTDLTKKGFTFTVFKGDFTLND